MASPQMIWVECRLGLLGIDKTVKHSLRAEMSEVKSVTRKELRRVAENKFIALRFRIMTLAHAVNALIVDVSDTHVVRIERRPEGLGGLASIRVEPR